MAQNTNTVERTNTESLVRAALELHRLALTAAEIRHLPSPVTPREKNAKGASDPTAGTALDPRREAVAVEYAGAMDAAAELIDKLREPLSALRDALDAWDGRKDKQAA